MQLYTDVRLTLTSWKRSIRPTLLLSMMSANKSAEPWGTLRSLTTDGLHLLQRRLKEEYPAYPTTINDEILHEHVERVGKLLLGPKNVTTANKVMAGEDFGFYQGVIPGVMFGIGIRNEDLGSVHSPHSPHFFLDEGVLPLGVALHTALAEIYLNDQWESVDKKDLRIESQGAL
ncbi:hypothetical protein IFM89_021365 [Coptis chinensis]|uniref:Uncharacterized protein n=1 Tax=Coptis chinensis TaxID=261450 RepID=A0A835M0Z9_9MAGN|nr:hypothetical protein IFM89_021365 [Coptis chinensis]